LLANDTEQAFLVETPRVRPERVNDFDTAGFGI
jgi:hypothetical protein